MPTTFTYVYILTSLSMPGKHYTGMTDNLQQRLATHNAGHVQSTAAARPWQIETSVAFRNRQKAAAFEKYMKSHSGRAFASKRF